MSDPLRSLIALDKAKQAAKLSELAANEMARHCDARIKKARKALSLIETFAWSAITADCPQSKMELMRRINVCRDVLKEL